MVCVVIKRHKHHKICNNPETEGSWNNISKGKIGMVYYAYQPITVRWGSLVPRDRGFSE